MTSITDPKSNRTKFIRDLQGRVTAKVFADGTGNSQTVNYIYEDRTSRLKSMTDALNRRTRYFYDNANNISQVSYTTTSETPLTPNTPSVNYTYDNYSRIWKMTDGTGLTTYAYYPVNSSPSLGAGKLQSIDGPLANDTIAFTYDELGRALSRSINGVAETGGA